MAEYTSPKYGAPKLFGTALHFPAIDNHAHPLLRDAHREDRPFEGLVSEADGEALKDSVYTVACMRATYSLGKLFGLKDASWDDVKAKRAELHYLDLCRKCIEPTRIQCILIDDGLGVKDLAEEVQWHDQFTKSPSQRIVRVEIEAESVLRGVFESLDPSSALDFAPSFAVFNQRLTEKLTTNAANGHVAAFKSIACYRTGLDISTEGSPTAIESCFRQVLKSYIESGMIRLAHKQLNDHIVRLALEIAGTHNKPIQFHTGLGDNDLSLISASPSHLQPVIKAYPQTKFVLLHSSYPYTREAGYLTGVYTNVFLDFGEVFPFVSGPGQRSILRQVLELSPTNKIMWSTDGHWWPESYYLGTIQARYALYEVLAGFVQSSELTEAQAVTIAENALFHNANKLYNLGLEPHGRYDS